MRVYTMSTTTFTMTNAVVMIMTIARTTGKSSRRIASTIADPRPGMRKMLSTMSDPPISAPVLMPKTVMNENSEGRSA